MHQREQHSIQAVELTTYAGGALVAKPIKCCILSN